MCMVHMGDPLHLFSSVTVFWLELSLSFDISVGDSRTRAILHHLWIKFDLFSWIRLLVVPLKAAVLLYQLVVGRYWKSERCCVKGSPASVGMLRVNKWQNDLTEKCCSSCTCPCVWSSVIALLPVPVWSLFHGGSSFSHSLCAAP